MREGRTGFHADENDPAEREKLNAGEGVTERTQLLTNRKDGV